MIRLKTWRTSESGAPLLIISKTVVSIADSASDSSGWMFLLTVRLDKEGSLFLSVIVAFDSSTKKAVVRCGLLK
jgi:hypothetical protein